MGKTGWIPTPKNEQKAFERLLGQAQGSPLFGDLYKGDADAGKGQLSLPYLSVLKFCPEAFGDEKQSEPDCTSHGVRNGCDIARAVEIDIKGEPEEWVARGATEPIYGMRGHSGGGMNVTRAAQFVHKKGFHVRKQYGQYDLSKYRGSVGARWGGRGTPADLQAEGRPMRHFAQVSHQDAERQIRAAIANGYGIPFGGVGGWDSRRGENGIARVGKASWNHCMCAGGYDDRCTLSSEPLVVVLQSWGDWIAGPVPDFPLPIGAALVPLSYFINTYVVRGETLIVGSADGFPAQSLPNYGSLDYLG